MHVPNRGDPRLGGANSNLRAEPGNSIDLTRNFSSWFYGDTCDLKPSSKANLKAFVETVIGANSNNQLNPKDFQYLTEGIRDSEPALVDQLKIYEHSLLDEELPPSTHKSRDGKKDNNHSGQSRGPETSQTHHLTLRLEPKFVYIDRRPMFKKNTDSQDQSVNSDSVIGPGEDCDSVDELEIIEIDCDT